MMPRHSSGPEFSQHGGVARAGPGLVGAFVVWGLWLAVAAATWATNAREPVARLYAVRAAGIRGGGGRVLVLLGWPVALIAIVTATIALDRLLRATCGRRTRPVLWALYIVLVTLCTTIVLPGAIDEKHLDGGLVNAPAAIGVALAFLLTLWSLHATGWGERAPVRRADRVWLIVFAFLLLAGIPWVLANLGFYAGDVPGLRDVFLSKQLHPEAGHPHLVAVHLGNHDGFDGLLVALSAVILARDAPRLRNLRRPTTLYLAFLVPYGLAVAANDWWGEQVVKRGWTSMKVGSFIRPSLTLPWLVIVLGGIVVWLVPFRRGVLPGEPIDGAEARRLVRRGAPF